MKRPAHHMPRPPELLKRCGPHADQRRRHGRKAKHRGRIE